MIKTLTRHGNSLALIIDKPILELLKIEPDSKLELSTNGTSLVITPASDTSCDERIANALAKVNRRHSAALKKLAE